MTIDIDAIRRREQAATPGPWQWYGNTDVYNIYLSSTRWGRQIVMDFERWGMNSAQPSFVQGRTWKPDSESDFDFGVSGCLTRARDLAVYEVAPKATSRKDPDVYRADIRGLRNPDAEFIAHARQDITDLLAELAAAKAEHEAHNNACVEEKEDLRAQLRAKLAEIEQLRAELAETREHLALDRQAVITLREREQRTHEQLAAERARTQETQP